MERTSMAKLATSRRQFLATGLALPAAALVPSAPATPKPVAQIGRARVAILSGVPECWSPHDWRTVPASGAIVEVSDPTSFRDARRQAKAFNADRRSHASEWAIVIASDGRKGGVV